MTRGDVWSIEAVDVEETDEAVTIGVVLRLPLTPFSGQRQDLPGHQSLALTVELSEPLENRTLGVRSSDGHVSIISDE